MNSFKNQFLKNLDNKSAKIAIVGLGYVGLPLAISFAEQEFEVIGLDVDLEKVTKINNGESYISHISSERLKNVSKYFHASLDFTLASQASAIIICVPTPLTIHREPDLSFVKKTMDKLLPNLVKGQLLSLESTTYPGTTKEVLLPLVESKGFNVGEDFFLVYSPEREDPANPSFHTSTIPKVIGGVTSNCSEVGLAVYGQVVEKMVPVSSTEAAELTKLLENIYRAVNIGLVNELKILADSMGLDIHEIINAAATKPFGYTPFYPGPGIGGHCIPIDPFYLTWKARAYGQHTRFIELAGEINCRMPHWVVEKLMIALNECSKSLKGSKILLLGLAYKKNVEDMRESPSVEILNILNKYGAEVSYSDPHVPVFPKMRKASYDLKSIELNKENLASFDAVLMLTDHKAFDRDFIAKHSKMIIDTRGVFKTAKNVIKA